MFNAGQRIVTADGDVVTVAMVCGVTGEVFAYRTMRRIPEKVTPRCDAFGGEHDQYEGLKLAA